MGCCTPAYAALLLGIYMILKLESSPDHDASSFDWLETPLMETFHDAAFT
jgi:hypothetical protein